MYQAIINGRIGSSSFVRRACFGDSLNMCTRINNNVEYTIVLIRDNSYVEEKHYNNYCLMSKHQLSNYLRRISSIKPFKYKVYDDELDGVPCFKIKLNMVGTKKEITFVLQCIKRTYEYPYNLFLDHAFKLQEIKNYKFDSILNLFNVVFSAYWSYPYTDHCFSGCCKFEKYQTLREKLPHITRVVDLYPNHVEIEWSSKKYKGIEYSGTVPKNSDQWDNVFELMLPTYIKNYELLKQ